MKSLKSLILEKFIINQSTKGFTKFDDTNKDMLIDIVKATFISLYKNFNFKRGASLAQYIIKRTEVKYDDICQVLNEYYNYNFDVHLFTNTKTPIYKFIKKYSVPANDILVNFKTCKIPAYNLELSGKDIYWNDWKNYRDKYNIKL